MEREPRTGNRFPRLHVMSIRKPPVPSRTDPTVATSRAGMARLPGGSAPMLPRVDYWLTKSQALLLEAGGRVAALGRGGREILNVVTGDAESVGLHPSARVHRIGGHRIVVLS